MGQSFSVRTAKQGDAPAIAAIHVESWRVAYRGLVPDDALATLSLTDFEARWLERLGGGERAHERTLVVESEGEVVGFAATGPCRDEEIDPGKLIELYAIYVHPDTWGQGHGRQLLNRTMADLMKTGHESLMLWVLEENLRARRFYEAAGFAADGTTKVKPRGEVQLREVRYVKRLSEPASATPEP